MSFQAYPEEWMMTMMMTNWSFLTRFDLLGKASSFPTCTLLSQFLLICSLVYCTFHKFLSRETLSCHSFPFAYYDTTYIDRMDCIGTKKCFFACLFFFFLTWRVVNWSGFSLQHHHHRFKQSFQWSIKTDAVLVCLHIRGYYYDY